MSKQSELVVISQDGIPPAAPPFNPRLTAPDAGTAVTTTYTVTVGSYNGANRYYLNTIVYPKLTLSRTYIYIFDLSDSTNTGHPLRFKDSAGSSYSTGVVVTGTPGSAGAKVTLTVAANAPRYLRYYCTVHGNGMGNTISVTNSASLDVGTNNYFDSGSLTDNTSVNFTSVPTNANWRYSCKTPNLDAFNISESVYKTKFSVGSYGVTDPQTIFFKPDGLMFFVACAATSYVYSFNMVVAWDIYNATIGNSYRVYPQENLPTGFFFKPDGTKFYVVGVGNDAVREYNLSTAWDVATAVYSQTFSVGSQTAYPHGLVMRADGLKMYVASNSAAYIYEYNLGTAWSVSTAVYSQSLNVSAQEAGPTGLAFNPTGTKLYVIGSSGLEVNEYDLSTAWDITSASALQYYSVTVDNALSDLFIRADGFELYVVGSQFDNVYKYDIGVPTKITLPASVVGTTSATLKDQRATYTFVTADSGSTVNLIAEEII